MAVSRSFSQFARRMKIVADRVHENAGLVVRRAALAADSAVVLSTPVDTGRARANWIASIGEPRREDRTSVDPSGLSTIADNAAIISTYKTGQGGIYLTNSVPYIIPLEEGWSQQAPSGMSQFAVQAAEAELQRGGLLEGI